MPKGRFFAIPGRRGSSCGRRRRSSAARGGGGCASPRRDRRQRRPSGSIASARRRGRARPPRRDRAGPSRRPGRRPSTQERRRELGEGREAADGARRDHVVGLAPAGGRLGPAQLLGPPAHDPARCSSPAASIARSMNSHLRPDRLDQVDPRGRAARPRAPGRETRRPRRRRRSPAPAQRLDLEPAERVGDVDAPRLLGVADASSARAGSLPSSSTMACEAQPRVGAGRGRRGPRSGLVNRSTQRRDDDAALGLVALAEGLDPGAFLEAVVDDAALGRGHRLELDLLARSRAPARPRGRPGARRPRDGARGSRRRRPRRACAPRGRGRPPGSRAAAPRRSSGRGGRSGGRGPRPSTRPMISSSSSDTSTLRVDVELVDDPSRTARTRSTGSSARAWSSSAAIGASLIASRSPWR